MTQKLIRDDKTNFSIIYDSTQRDSYSVGGYEHLRIILDEAEKDNTIDQDSKEEMIGKLNHTRNIAIMQARNFELGKINQDLIDPDFLR